MKDSDFKFLGYRISKISCEIKDSYKPGESKYQQSINIQQNYSDEENRFVEIIFDTEVKTEDENLYFLVRIKGGFQAHENMPEHLFKNLAEHNGPAILYPFIRAIISSYSAQANIPPIILPTVNFSSLDAIEKIKERKKDS